MVKLTIELIAKGTSGYTKKKRDEDMEHYLKRLTHLYLEDKCIDDVVSIHVCVCYFSALIPKGKNTFFFSLSVQSGSVR